MTGAPYEYVSIIATNLVQPIADLLSILDSRNPRGPNEVQASVIENGYSCSVVVLSVFLLESIINRGKYVTGCSPPLRPVRFLEDAVGVELASDAEELFALRDVVAHNHVWKATVVDDPQHGMQFQSASIQPGYGDAKFLRVVDLTSRLTKRLGLDVFPTRIHRKTASTVLKKVGEILWALESQDRHIVYLSPWLILKPGGPGIPFYDWVSSL